MYNVSYKNIKKSFLFFSIFIVIGVLFFIIFGSILFSGTLKKMKLDSETVAVSIDDNCHINQGDKMCQPIYYYMVDGVSYQCKTSISIEKIVNKAQDKVYYDSKNPAKCINEYESSSSIVSWLVLLIPVLFVGAGLFNFIKGIMRIKKIKYLAKYGTLFKGLNYELQYTGMVINNKQILAPVVNFTLPNGSTIKLVGDARHDGKMYDQDGLVDLLIDLNDPKNYYIDFEISYKE